MGRSIELHPAANLTDRFLLRWRTDPDRPVLRDIDGRWLSGGELEARSRAAAVNLRRAGLSAGDRLVLCSANCAAFVIAYVASLRAGLVAIALNPAYTPAELHTIVRDAQPAAALVADCEQARVIAEAADGPIVTGGLDVALPAARAAAAAAPAASAPIDVAELGDAALMLYTSGTTGRPKGALLSHGNLLASATAVAFAWHWTAADRLLLALPLFHMHGLGVAVNGGLAAGGQIVLRPGFDAADTATACADRVTMFFGVPAMYQRLAAAGRAGALASLRLLVSGSAPLSAELGHVIAQQSGQFPLERYGMTETVMLTSNPVDGPRRAGTVGLPFPGVEVRLGDGGEVQVRGPNVFAGYDRRPQATAEAFTNDGWFRTGDLGEFDPAGYLRLTGRSKELIISGGFNVSPREVEDVIARYPGVREVAVIGRPSDTWGEAVTAVVVRDGSRPVEPALLRAHAAASLAPYKVPKQVEFVDELPRNALGKILRHEL